MSLSRLSILVLLAGLSTTAVRGQDQVAEPAEAIPDTLEQRVATAFRAGDVRRLLSPAASRVEVSLFGTRTLYSSAQAFYVLREFFDTHPPADFILADATTTGDSFFLRGRFEHTRDDRPLQVYIRLVRQEETPWQLQEVRIDSEIE